MKKLLSLFLVVLIICCTVLPCSALSHSTYSDLAQNNSTVQNLLSFAMNYDTFSESKFVVYTSAQNTYFIVWGDLNYLQNKIISNSEIHYIEYSRDSDLQYTYKTSVSDNFTLAVNDVVVTNIDGVGMNSQIYEEFKYRENFSNFSIIVLVFLFVILLFKIRKG